MQVRKYIALIGLLLSLWSLEATAQQAQSVVCAGDTGIAYYVSGFDHSTFQWTVEGGTITRNFGDSIMVDWNVGAGQYRITVRETSEYGCVGPVRSAMVIVAGPDIDLGEDPYICEGDFFEIEAGDDYSGYFWHDGSTAPFFATDQEGWIAVTVTDAYGCADRDSIYLSVYPLPAVELGNDTTLCGEESLVLDGGTDGSAFSWSTGEIGQYLTVFSGPTRDIWVVVEDRFGCVNSDTITIERCNVEFYFRDIPNAITANEDGLNDVWNLQKLTGYSQAVVEIFDQWGTLVWRSEPGYSIPWDGRDLNGRLVPVDSYHFVIDLKDGSGERLTGIVTVIR